MKKNKNNKAVKQKKELPSRKVLKMMLQALIEKGITQPDIIYNELNISDPQTKQWIREEIAPFQPHPKAIIGIVDHVNFRFAYVSVEKGPDIWVKSDMLNGAIDGDQVEIALTKKNTRRPEGTVKKILKRKKNQWVGKITVSKNINVVTLDNRKIYFDVVVDQESAKDSNTGDKVIVEVTEWPHKNGDAFGKVVKNLGKSGEHNAEIHSIMAEFELPFEFPTSVEEEAAQISIEITPEIIENRRDFREVLTFTIDPYDAKDFDDALSIQMTSDGKFEIGVHIADVSHYVTPNSLLDLEAIERATSVYLVDRTIPMLPEKLSNQLCSLVPHEDRLTVSAVFIMNHRAEIEDTWFGKTIIHSNRRFTYEEVQEILDKESGDYAQELKSINQLAKQIREKRFKKGAVNFETVEVKFELDENGKPLKIIPKIRKDAHKLIEEFMLLANKAVAEYVFKLSPKVDQPYTFVYRIHDDPSQEKLQNFAQFAKKFGHQIQTEGNIAAELNKLMETIEGKPEQNILESIAIRSMAKAKYTTEPNRHFGLAFNHYTHFTSPIRRYPDVMVHRLLMHYLQKGQSVSKKNYEEWCVHSSEREKRAADAERASIKYKQVEYMSEHLGLTFEGIVSGIMEYGIL